MMKINFKHSGIEMEITYDENGYLNKVININTDEYMMLESKIEGIGYKIKTDNFIGYKNNICDARYVRIMDLDIFIPRIIFIENFYI